jgi:3-oxoacyl-[acyl-carrier protein] reductase
MNPNKNPRVAMVTGANGGIGLAVARRLLSKTPDSLVWLGIHSRRENADQLAETFAGRATVISLDVTDRPSWDRVVLEIVAKAGRLDVLVNNAGTHEDSLLATMPAESWDRVLATNLNSVFHGCQSVMRTMIGQRFGRIVNVSSLSALLAPPGQTNYAASKAGVIGFTQSLAKEVARMNITVNAVCPGYVETDAIANLPTDHRKSLLDRIPMRRLGRPEDVASAIDFLASDDAGYITGATLKVDGGIL